MKSDRETLVKKSGYHHGNLRDDLIAATRSLIESVGAEHFKVADACRLAGVSTAAPYRHFSDRQAMLDAVAIVGFQDLRDQARSAGVQHTQGSVDAVSAIGKAYVEFASRQPNLFRLMFGQRATEMSDKPGADIEAKKNRADAKAASEYSANPLEAAGRECYEVLLEQLLVTLERESIDEAVVKAAFPLWTFVHGLSFLIIDDNLSVNRLPIDIANQIDRATECLMP